MLLHIHFFPTCAISLLTAACSSEALLSLSISADFTSLDGLPTSHAPLGLGWLVRPTLFSSHTSGNISQLHTRRPLVRLRDELAKIALAEQVEFEEPGAIPWSIESPIELLGIDEMDRSLFLSSLDELLWRGSEGSSTGTTRAGLHDLCCKARTSLVDPLVHFHQKMSVLPLPHIEKPSLMKFGKCGQANEGPGNALDITVLIGLKEESCSSVSVSELPIFSPIPEIQVPLVEVRPRSSFEMDSSGSIWASSCLDWIEAALVRRLRWLTRPRNTFGSSGQVSASALSTMQPSHLSVTCLDLSHVQTLNDVRRQLAEEARALTWLGWTDLSERRCPLRLDIDMKMNFPKEHKEERELHDAGDIAVTRWVVGCLGGVEGIHLDASCQAALPELPQPLYVAEKACSSMKAPRRLGQLRLPCSAIGLAPLLLDKQEGDTLKRRLIRRTQVVSKHRFPPLLPFPERFASLQSMHPVLDVQQVYPAPATNRLHPWVPVPLLTLGVSRSAVSFLHLYRCTCSSPSHGRSLAPFCPICFGSRPDPTWMASAFAPRSVAFSKTATLSSWQTHVNHSTTLPLISAQVVYPSQLPRPSFSTLLPWPFADFVFLRLKKQALDKIGTTLGSPPIFTGYKKGGVFRSSSSSSSAMGGWTWSPQSIVYPRELTLEDTATLEGQEVKDRGHADEADEPTCLGKRRHLDSPHEGSTTPLSINQDEPQRATPRKATLSPLSTHVGYAGDEEDNLDISPTPKRRKVMITGEHDDGMGKNFSDNGLGMDRGPRKCQWTKGELVILHLEDQVYDIVQAAQLMLSKDILTLANQGVVRRADSRQLRLLEGDLTLGGLSSICTVLINQAKLQPGTFDSTRLIILETALTLSYAMTILNYIIEDTSAWSDIHRLDDKVTIHLGEQTLLLSHHGLATVVKHNLLHYPFPWHHSCVSQLMTKEKEGDIPSTDVIPFVPSVKEFWSNSPSDASNQLQCTDQYLPLHNQHLSILQRLITYCDRCLCWSLLPPEEAETVSPHADTTHNKHAFTAPRLHPKAKYIIDALQHRSRQGDGEVGNSGLLLTQSHRTLLLSNTFAHQPNIATWVVEPCVEAHDSKSACPVCLSQIRPATETADPQAIVAGPGDAMTLSHTLCLCTFNPSQAKHCTASLTVCSARWAAENGHFPWAKFTQVFMESDPLLVYHGPPASAPLPCSPIISDPALCPSVTSHFLSSDTCPAVPVYLKRLENEGKIKFYYLSMLVRHEQPTLSRSATTISQSAPSTPIFITSPNFQQLYRASLEQGLLEDVTPWTLIVREHLTLEDVVLDEHTFCTLRPLEALLSTQGRETNQADARNDASQDLLNALAPLGYKYNRCHLILWSDVGTPSNTVTNVNALVGNMRSPAFERLQWRLHISTGLHYPLQVTIHVSGSISNALHTVFHLSEMGTRLRSEEDRHQWMNTDAPTQQEEVLVAFPTINYQVAQRLLYQMQIPLGRIFSPDLASIHPPTVVQGESDTGREGDDDMNALSPLFSKDGLNKTIALTCFDSRVAIIQRPETDDAGSP